MNDFEAMEAINSILEQFYRGNLAVELAVLDIAKVAGANQTQHQQAGPQ
jgi:hypothetical protein